MCIMVINMVHSPIKPDSAVISRSNNYILQVSQYLSRFLARPAQRAITAYARLFRGRVCLNKSVVFYSRMAGLTSEA